MFEIDDIQKKRRQERRCFYYSLFIPFYPFHQYFDEPSQNTSHVTLVELSKEFVGLQFALH